MRVKSRKPAPAKENSSVASGRAAIIDTSAKASACGRWLTAAKTWSWRSGSICTSRAPHKRQAASTRLQASAEVSGSGVSTTRRFWNNEAVAASTPERSAPAMGWAGTNCASFPPRRWRAATATSRLVLPASVTTQSGSR